MSEPILQNEEKAYDLLEKAKAEAIYLIEEARNEAIKTTEAQNLLDQQKEKQMIDSFQKALEEVFKIKDGDGNKRFVDVSRIPLICQSIVQLHEDVGKIRENLTWIVRMIIGSVVLGLLALLFKS